jgi:hypothetical protein
LDKSSAHGRDPNAEAWQEKEQGQERFLEQTQGGEARSKALEHRRSNTLNKAPHGAFRMSGLEESNSQAGYMRMYEYINGCRKLLIQYALLKKHPLRITNILFN